MRVKGKKVVSQQIGRKKHDAFERICYNYVIEIKKTHVRSKNTQCRAFESVESCVRSEPPTSSIVSYYNKQTKEAEK